MLQRPEGGTLPCGGVGLYGGETEDAPLIGFALHEVAAKVVLVETLHDNDDWGVAAVRTGADGVLEAGVDALAGEIGLRVLGLHRVVDDDGTTEHAGRVHLVEQGYGRVVQREVVERRRGLKPLRQRRRGQRGRHGRTGVARTEARHLTLGRDGVELSALGGLPPFGRAAFFLQARIGEQLFVERKLHRASYGVGVVLYERIGVGQVQEAALRVKCEAPRNEALHGQLGFGVTRRYVDDKAVALTIYHVLQSVDDELVVA